MNFEEALKLADEAVFVKVGRRLSQVEIAILKGSWQHETYEQIASAACYSVAYIKQHIGPELWKLLSEALDEKVTKKNFQSALERRWRKSWKANRAGETLDNSVQNLKSKIQNRADWGEAIDVSVFYGRTAELNTLNQWLIEERCRLVALLGMGGIGKTSLAAKLAQQVEGQFDFLIWRSNIMYWLAVNREPVSLTELQNDILSLILPQQLLEALESLLRRSLVEKISNLFTLQSVVMEYITNGFIQNVWTEIKTQNLDLFRSHTLIKATVKDYIRDIQIRLILKPVINGLLTIFRNQQVLENQLNKILVKLRKTFSEEQNYAAGNILNMLCYLGTNLSNYDFSHLTVRQADLRNVNLHNVNFNHAHLAQSLFAETFGGVLSLAFSPNGKFLAIGDMNSEIRLYQVGDWKQLNILKGHTDWVSAIAFNHDSSILASGSEDQTIKLWNVTNGQCLNTLQGHEQGIWSLVFTSDGKVLVSGSDDKTVKIWDVNTGQCLKTLLEHQNMVRAVVLSPDNKVLISGSVDKTLKLWNVSTGKCLRTLQEHNEGIWSVAISPNGRILASGSGDGVVKLWDIKTGECLMTLQGHCDWVMSLGFSQDGQILASGSWDQKVKW